LPAGSTPISIVTGKIPRSMVTVGKADFIGIGADGISCISAYNKIVAFDFIQPVNGTLVKAAVTLPPRVIIVEVLAFFTAKYLVAFNPRIVRFPLKGRLTICMAGQWESYREQNHKTDEYSSYSKILDHFFSLILPRLICLLFQFHRAHSPGNEVELLDARTPSLNSSQTSPLRLPAANERAASLKT
jgi:hypothetical protein